MNTSVKKEDGSKEYRRSVCNVQRHSLSSMKKEGESKMTPDINLPKHSSSDTVVNGSTEKLFSEISAYDSSRACLLPNGDLTISNSDLDIKCRNERFKCMIPFKYDKDYMSNFSNRVFLRNEIYCSKFFLTDVLNIESSEEDVKDDMDAKPLTKRLCKTLTGWDKLGMHYWLSRMNKSRRLTIETVPSDSWFHVHMCDKCLQQLNFQCNLCQTTTFLPENAGTLLYDENILQNDSEPTEYATNDVTYNSEYEDATDGFYCSKNCSEQYFKRIVYCTNGCGLNFKFPEEHFRREPEISHSNLNPFMRVVVFGTDPCGLNFPVDFETLDSNSSNEKFFLSYELSNDESEFNLSNDFFFSPEMGGKETDCEKSGELIVINQALEENKEVYYDDFVSTLPLNDDHGGVYKHSQSSSMTLSEFSGNDMVNLEDIILTPVDELTEMKEQIQCKTNLELVNHANDKKSDIFLLNRTVSNTDISSKSVSSQLKISASKRLSWSTITSSSVSLVLHPRSSTYFKNEYYLTHPEKIKMVEFSFYRKFNKTSKQKPCFVSLKLARRQIRKRRKGKFLIHFPDSSSVKVRMIAIGRNNTIFVQKKSSEVVNISKKHTIFKFDALSILPFFMQVIIYFFLMGAFSFIFIVINEFLKGIHSTPPKRQWYHGF